MDLTSIASGSSIVGAPVAISNNASRFTIFSTASRIVLIASVGSISVTGVSPK